MRVVLFLTSFADRRSYYAAIGALESAGWDVVPEWDDSASAYHPAVLTRRGAAVALAALGLPAWRFGYVADGPAVGA